MKLERLIVENFRQFRGRYVLGFASDEKKNVTLIWGANGAGKTTLLNAFTWALYNKTTPAFEDPTNIVSRLAIAEATPGTVVGRVVVEFEHDGCLYEVRRETKVRKYPDETFATESEGVLSAFRTNEDGSQDQLRNPSDSVNQILPESLHRFFFFDGERIEHAVKPEAQKDIQAAVKTILGLEVVERAVKHLRTARGKLEAELRTVGSPAVGALTEELMALSKEADDLKAERDVVTAKMKAKTDELAEVEERLRASEKSREYQEQRENLEATLAALQNEDKKTAQAIDAAIANRGFLAFAKGLCTECVQQYSERKSKGEIPSPIKRDFVETLLADGKCICKRSLDATDSPQAHEAVCEWRDRAGLPDVEVAWTRVGTQAEELLRMRDQMYLQLMELETAQTEQRAEQKRIGERLSELHMLIGERESELGTDLEQRRQRLQDEKEALQRRVYELDRDHKDRLEDVASKRKELSNAELEDEKARLALRRVNAVAGARDVFERILALRTDDVRQELDGKMKRTYEQIVFKPYVPRLTEDFYLELERKVGSRYEPVPKGQGENQVLSLSFIASIAALARERYSGDGASDGLGETYGERGGLYPIVADSPFGSLDDNYRRDVATIVPKLAPQVVLFVTKAQGQGSVEEGIRMRIGAEYAISYFTDKSDAVPESVEIVGKEYPYISVVDNAERAEILAVTH